VFGVTAPTTSRSDAPHPQGGGASARPDEVAAHLRLSATRLARRLRTEAEIGLTPSLLSALAMVHVHGPLTLGALAELEAIAPPSVTKIVAKLQEQDLVERIHDPSDRRVCRVVTTDAGEQLLDRSRARKNAWLAERLATATPAELATLEQASAVIDRLLQADPAEEPR
jgi:DNA-binding MarR family transcriptional regulator